MIKEALETNERFEGLAFAMLIKMRFQDSYLKGSIRQQKQVLGMGQNTLQRAKKAALKYGYCVLCEDGRIFANKVRIKGKRSYQRNFSFTPEDKRTVRRGRNTVMAKGTKTTLQDIVFFLKQILIQNRVKQQNVYSDTVKDVTRGSSAKRRRAVRRLHSMWKRSDKASHTPYENLSFAKMQSIACCSNYAAHNMIKAMTRDGVLERRACVISTEKYFGLKRPIEALSRKKDESYTAFRHRLAFHYLNVNLAHREQGGCGYIRQYKGHTFIRLADTYKDVSHTISKRGF